MEETIHVQTDKILDNDSLFLASSILLGASRTARDIQIIAAAFLHYAMIGSCITDRLMDLMIPTSSDEH